MHEYSLCLKKDYFSKHLIWIYTWSLLVETSIRYLSTKPSGSFCDLWLFWLYPVWCHLFYPKACLVKYFLCIVDFLLKQRDYLTKRHISLVCSPTLKMQTARIQTSSEFHSTAYERPLFSCLSVHLSFIGAMMYWWSHGNGGRYLENQFCPKLQVTVTRNSPPPNTLHSSEASFYDTLLCSSFLGS